VVFDYLDGGAEAEVTLRENVEAFERMTFRPLGATATPEVDLTVTVVGQRMALPFILAPIGSTRLFHPRGEEASARAADEAGVAYTLSTLSGTAMEEVRRATRGPAWYQLYLCGGRDGAARALDRARAAGFTALVVTIDTAVAGMRERDVRNGARQLTAGGLAMLPYLPQLLTKLSWLAGLVADGGLMKFPNVLLADGSPMPYADVARALGESVVCWDDFEWIGKRWDGPIIVKGAHRAEDAQRAIDVGAAGIVVSNHGGRQLDGVAASVSVLPEIVDAAGTKIDVLVDGGIRRGGDIVKALCLGARAVLVGRAYAYGLAAGGHDGVARAIEILRADLVRTMKLLGCGSVSALGPGFLKQDSNSRTRYPR
jgi:L-lactate dehydrogenase (cytochrome)